MKRVLLTIALLCAAAPACDDDDDAAAGNKPTDAATDMAVDKNQSDTGTSVDAGDAAGGDAGSAALEERGRYLVNGVLGCGGCHTSREAGAKPFAGVKCFRDTMPTVDGKGCINSANLTNHSTGLGTRTPTQIKDMLRKGVRPDGKYLFSHMPSYLFANLTDGDADAIVAYLKTVTGVDNMLPANEDPWTDDKRPMAQSPQAVKLEAIPTAPAAADPAAASRGRYLAALSCIECHTPAAADPLAFGFDVARAFEGGRSFTVGAATVVSMNLTPDDTGIKAYSAAGIVKVLKMGIDKDGKRVCSPMRSYAGMTDADANDIANYLLALPPKVNAISMQCSMDVVVDGGTDAGNDGGDAANDVATEAGAD
jgi:mono/diheme cytochrome c family protein